MVEQETRCRIVKVLVIIYLLLDSHLPEFKEKKISLHTVVKSCGFLLGQKKDAGESIYSKHTGMIYLFAQNLLKRIYRAQPCRTPMLERNVWVSGLLTRIDLNEWIWIRYEYLKSGHSVTCVFVYDWKTIGVQIGKTGKQVGCLGPVSPKSSWCLW